MMRFVLPAVALSVGLHAGLLALAGAPDSVEHGAETSVSSTVIVFDAPSAPAASASVDADRVAEQPPVEAEEQASEALPDEEPAGTQPAEVVEHTDTEHAVLEPVVEAPTGKAHPVVEPRRAVPPALNNTPAPAAEPGPVKPDETRPFVPVPRIKPQVPAEFARKQRSSEQPARRKENQRRAGKAASGSAGKKKAQRRTGSAGRSGGASAGEKAAYARRVLSHIQRYKRFPRGASAGKVRLKVRISASGRLQSATVRRSSGHRILDKAALATARHASPYPKPPGGKSFSFTVALRYKR